MTKHAVHGAGGKPLHTTRLFRNLLALFCGMFLLMFAAAFLYANSTASRRLEQQTRQASQALLERMDHYYAQSLSVISNALQQAIWNTDVVGLTVAPELAGYERRTQVERVLEQLKRDHPMVEDAWLWNQYEQLVYQATGPSSGQLSPALQNILTQLASGRPGAVFQPGRPPVYFYPGETLHLVCPTPTPEWNGALMVRLNSDSFFSTADHLTDSAQSIRIFVAGQPVYTAGALWNQEEPPIIQLHSTKTGLEYQLQPVPHNSAVSWSELWAVIVPMLLVFLLVSVAFTIYISRTVYRPINSLFNVVLRTAPHRGDDRGAPKHEIDFVTLAYENAVERTEALDAQLKAIAPTIREKLYRNLLQGKPLSQEEIRQALELGQSPFAGTEQICILMMVCQEFTGNPVELQRELYYFSIQALLAPRLEQVLHDWLTTDNNELLLLLGFPTEARTAHIQHTVCQLTLFLQQQAKSLPYRLMVGCGEPQQGIAALSLCLQSAAADFRYRSYDVGDCADAPAPEASAPRSTYRQQAEAMAACALEGRLGEAQAQLSLYLSQLSRLEDPELRRRAASLLVNSLVETLISSGGSPELPDPPAPQASFSCVDDWIAEAEPYAQTMLQQLERSGKRRQYRHMELAKSYLESHYMDSALSLDTVSEYVGIHRAYLSRLFNESGTGFVDSLNQMRVRQAKYLLCNTEITIKEIGFKTGFHSAQNFNRVFKKYAGITPTGYRDAARQKGGPVI